VRMAHPTSRFSAGTRRRVRRAHHFKLKYVLKKSGHEAGRRDKINTWFEQTADKQYTRELLFSSIFELMNGVVFKTDIPKHSDCLSGQEREHRRIGDFGIQQVKWIGG